MKNSLKISFWAVAVIWIVFILNYVFFTVEFRAFGIRPRDVYGLIGIPLSPFLHGNLDHIISNSIPLFLLTLAIAQFYRKLWLPVTIFSIFAGGFAVWLFAESNSNHIGASGVIFSYIGFLLFSGIFRRSFISILIGIVVFVLYGGALWNGIIPNQPGVSWQGHLFGAVAGIFAAYIYRNKYKQANKIK